MLKGEVLVESVVVSYVVQMFVRFSNAGISVHDHCGRSLVCRFDDDVSSFLEFVDGLFLLMGEDVLLRLGVNLLVSFQMSSFTAWM